MTLLEALRTAVESVKSWAEGEFIRKQDNVSKITTVDLVASAWVLDNGLYRQSVFCPGITQNSKLDLQPTPAQIVELQNDNIALMAVNNNGFAIIYAFNNQPTSNMTVQVLLTEVAAV